MLKFLPLLLLLAPFAEARDRTGQLSVGGSTGLAFDAPWAGETFRDAVGIGPKLSLLGRYHHTDTGVELSFDYFRLSNQSLSSASLSVSLFWRYLESGRIHPVLSTGFGLSKASNFFGSGSGDQPFFRLRAGVEMELNENTDLAFHLDHFTMFKRRPADPHLHVLAPSVGLIRYFGSPPPPTPPAAAAAAADADGDGVPDSADRCPGTPNGAKVNALGCAPGQSFELALGLSFPAGSAQPSGRAAEALEELAKILRENPEMKAEIQSHTDNRGAAARNRKLSQDRAQAVRQLLIRQHKISGSRIQARGLGSSQPAASNKTAEGRKMNSRTVVKVFR
jgi:OmpA-OmpF porin, OOP family